MSESLRIRLTHALLSILMSVGLLFPLFGILEPSLISPVLLFRIACIIFLFELACINRITAVVSAGLVAVLLSVWLFCLNGLLTVSDVVLAVAHRSAGIRTALPLVADPAAVLLTAAVALISCFACLRGVSVLPASVLCFGMILLIYLSGAGGTVIAWFLPALLALLLMLMTERFTETPILPLLPFAILLVVIAFLLTGNGPGMNPLRQKADELRQAVLDRLFFTEPRDVFSLSSEGYYPQGRDQLGGRPEPADHTVMQVSAPRTVYLRGVVFNQYTGRSWQNTAGGRRYLFQSPGKSENRALLFDEHLPPVTVRNALCEPSTVSVRMLSDSASTLFVPQRVRDLSPGGDLVPYFSDSSELFITRNLKAGDTYSVSAPLFMAGDPGLGTLIEVCSTLEDNSYSRILETYTMLPGHLEEPVYVLAREAASVASAPYERALAIQSWLCRSFRYSIDVDDQPENIDFVTRFLLDTQEGYCTYFASAMTVLCRMVGIPARYVEGYLAEPDKNGEAVVTGRSAHAWTEVYFKGFGWLTFDATPKRGSGNGMTASDPAPSPSPGPEAVSTPEPFDPEGLSAGSSPESETEPSLAPSAEPPELSGNSPDSSPDEQASAPLLNDSHSSFSLWIFLLITLLLLSVFFRILFTSPSFRARHAKTESEKFDIWIRDVTDLLYAENLSRKPGETPMAFGRRIDRTGLFSVALGPVGECVSLIRYSPAEAEEADTGLIRDTSILLMNELSRPARIRYLFRRVFVPLSRRDSL